MVDESRIFIKYMNLKSLKCGMKCSKNKCKLLCDCNNQLKCPWKTGTEIGAEHKSLSPRSSWTHVSELFHEII